MVKYNVYFLFLCAALSHPLYCMEESKPDRAKCENVTPFSSAPFTYVPKYVFENCNQVTRYSWDNETFKKLKNNVAKADKTKIARQYKEKAQFVKNAEGYDWIHGLNYLEVEYLRANKDLAESLTVQELKKINGLFSRLIADTPGEFRAKNILWRRRSFNGAETILFEFIDQGTPDKIFTGNNEFGLMLDSDNNISANSIRRLLTAYAKNRGDVIGLKSDVNPNELTTWLDEQSQLTDKSKKNKLNFLAWREKRVHEFPSVETLESEVCKALEKIKDPTMHPIEKAAYIWYEIVRIHISHEANKRTGKALASVILLQHGYLPPLITSEDERRYVDTFLEAFGKEDGFEKFLDFVIEMIIKTQQMFEDTALV